MPPALIVDIASVDLDRTVYSREQIYRDILPQRHEFQLLDGLCHLSHDAGELISYCDVREDAWWVRGHIPGRPIMPGVIMLEAAAQTANVGAALEDLDAYKRKGFIGFGGVGDCKFRLGVLPPARLYILCTRIESRPRRFVSMTQGVVDGRIVFQATITGIVIG